MNGLDRRHLTASTIVPQQVTEGNTVQGMNPGHGHGLYKRHIAPLHQTVFIFLRWLKHFETPL